MRQFKKPGSGSGLPDVGFQGAYSLAAVVASGVSSWPLYEETRKPTANVLGACSSCSSRYVGLLSLWGMLLAIPPCILYTTLARL